MRTRQLVISVLSALALALAACGGDDGGGGTPDAPPAIDAAIDAPPAVAMGLGKVCAMPSECPTSAPICAMIGSSATGFCTLSCGSGAVPAMGMDPMPPAGGNAICMGATPAPPSGTPACALTAAASMNMIPWACGILCGTFMSTDLGNCPTGLTCNANLCE